jgi:hypothetical protein
MTKEWQMGSIFESVGNGVVGPEGNGVDLSEAARQLQQAAHDARVAFDCIGLDEIDRAHTHALTARAAVDAAENALRVALGGDRSPAGI